MRLLKKSLHVQEVGLVEAGGCPALGQSIPHLRLQIRIPQERRDEVVGSLCREEIVEST